jgi:hypothetical protein
MISFTDEQPTAEAKKQLYLQRVNHFYQQVKNWYTAENFSFSTEERIFRDKLGTYQSALLAIKTKDEELLAKLVPMGASSLLGEGVIEIVNWLGEEHIVYLLQGGPTLMLPSGERQPRLKGVTQEGWYWLEDPRTKQTRLVDKERLLNLITLVSDYEFESP